MLANVPVFSSLDRQRARFRSSRVEPEEPRHEDDDEQVVSPVVVEEEDDDVEDVDLERGNDATMTSPASEEEEEEEEASPEVVDNEVRLFARTTMTLAELEEERELARRRSSACILLAAFVLFRLWVLALETGDFGLLLLCLVGTSWTARWISYNREREEELDRRIANYLENSEPGTTEVDRNELRMLSFQAQLALAIMESQRQMMQGGYGHPDPPAGNGVSDEAKARWVKFNFTEDAEQQKKAGYGSVSQKEKDGLTDEAPHCSICLSEYEDGEELVKLPCKHLYHEECIGSWTSNHTRCPLCNFDLQSVAGDSSSSRDDSIV